MKKILIISGLFAILFLTACGSSIRVFHDLDPAATFDQYKTYSFLDWTDGNIRTIGEAEREQIMAAVAREAESNGFTFKENNADIKIQVTVYFRNARRHYHHHYGYPGFRYNTNERALAVDMFEGTSKKHVWHSAAVGYLGSSKKDRAEELPSVVSQLFEEYPAKEEI